MFKYVLQDAIPKLIRIDVYLKVRAFVSDGDPHLIAMITQAITNLYVNAKIIPCAWHLVDRSMVGIRSRFHTRHGRVTAHCQEWFCRFLQRWLYTWMQPSGGIYSKDEFEVTKAILLCMLKSKLISDFVNRFLFLSKFTLQCLKKKKPILADRPFHKTQS
jgi:hypothetical protein